MKTFKQNRFVLITLVCLACYFSSFSQNYFAGTGAGTGNTGGQVTGVGYNVLHSANSGIYNSGFGYNALTANTSGLKNTAIGANVLPANNGSYNTATGYAALYTNTSGSYNVAYGHYSLFANTTASYNTAFGTYSLQANKTGSGNVAVGYEALYSNTVGYYNNAIGEYAMEQNTTGNYNTAIGGYALNANTTGAANISIGYESLSYNLGSNNIAIGLQTVALGSHGYQNIAIGSDALYLNDADNNTAVGDHAMFGYSRGGQNMLRVGSGNTAIGSQALKSIDKKSKHITVLGYEADISVVDLHNSTAIGYGAIVDASDKVVVGSTDVTVIGGQVGWSNFSDGRFKKDIQQNVPGLKFINQLRPVTYHTELEKLEKFLGKSDSALNEMEPELKQKEKQLHTGFIAQDVEIAAQNINYDFDGINHPQNDKDNYSLVYSDFVPSLVKAIQELSTKNDSKDSLIANLQQQINELKAMITSNQSSAVNQQSIALSSASLTQNIPNPFNNTTTINYSIPQQLNSAKIIITDKNGSTIKTINISGGGKGSVKIDASTLASGAYQYSLYVNNTLIDTKQMVSAK